MDKTVFRELPGVAELELKLLDPKPLMKDELEDLRKEVDGLSLELFGITEEDTLQPYIAEGATFTEEYQAEAERWPTYFDWLEAEASHEEHYFWDAIGIDMTDEDGDYLACLPVFGRQITVVARSAHPAASYRFQPGRPLTDAQTEAAAEAWGRMLLDR